VSIQEVECAHMS